MRRFAALLLSLVLLVTMAATGSAASDTRVLFDEQAVQFDANPLIEDGRTLVPVRELAEHLGFTVGWNEAAQTMTLTRGDTTIELVIGSTKVVVNGKEGTLDVPPKQVNNRTYVSVRFVAERLGAHVAWDEKQNTVVVTSGRALFVKVNKQQALDQKTTADFQVDVEISNLKQATGPALRLKIPMHMEMQLYHNDMLVNTSMQMSAVGQSTTMPVKVQMAVKDGQMYVQDAVTRKWQKLSADKAGATDMAAQLKQYGLSDIALIQAEVVQQAVVSVGGVEEMDGVQVMRLDVDLSKVNVGSMVEKMLGTVMKTSDLKLDIKVNVERYKAQYWVNPATQFIHKLTIDLAMNMDVTDTKQNLSVKMAMTGEQRSTPLSEPIQFPDFDAPGFTAEEKISAQAYWDGLLQDVSITPCFDDAKDVESHWADKSYKEGRTAAALAAMCFGRQRRALAALRPPAEASDAHKALSVGLAVAEKAYTDLIGAFELAASGDMAAADTKKAAVMKLSAASRQLTTQAGGWIAQLLAKYELK